MFSGGDEGQQGLVLTVVSALVALVVALVMGVAVHHRKPLMPSAKGIEIASAAVSPGPPASASPAHSLTAVQAAQAASDAASVTVERDVVKFYFASGKADLAAGAGEALAGMVSAAKSGRMLVISGFHDATGDARKNAELARQRAQAVHSALKALGVAEQQIDLKKPEQRLGNGSNAEARRVEITLR